MYHPLKLLVSPDLLQLYQFSEEKRRRDYTNKTLYLCLASCIYFISLNNIVFD